MLNRIADCAGSLDLTCMKCDRRVSVAILISYHALSVSAEAWYAFLSYRALAVSAEDQNLHCLSGLRANFAKFSFQKYPQLPAITCRGQSHTLTPWPVTQARLAQHVELTVTRVTHHAQRQARLIRPGPSHSQQPAVHHSPQPASLAAARVTRSGPPSPAAACRHLPRAVTVVTRSGPPSLATARLNRRGPGTRRGQSHSDGAAARLCSPQPASLLQ